MWNKLPKIKTPSHLFEGKFVRELEGHHNHTGYPEEQNVVSGFEQAKEE